MLDNWTLKFPSRLLGANESKLVIQLGPCFNIKMFYQYRKSHRGDKTIIRLSYLHNGISYLGTTTSIYWNGSLIVFVQVLYVLQLHIDNEGSQANVCSISEFLLTQPCLSFVILDASRRKFSRIACKEMGDIGDVTTGEGWATKELLMKSRA